MSTTVFITHCWKSAGSDAIGRRLGRWLGGALLPLVLALVALVLLTGGRTAWAQNGSPEVGPIYLERGEEGVYLSTQVRFELPTLVEDALLKGIPMFFVAEAEVLRDRWYWYDKKVVEATRHLRLAYQPLTRRWRLNVSPTPIGNSGLGVALAQNFDSLADALAAIQRFSRWKIAEPGEIDPDARHSIDFRFRLDVSQLPRPFQIGAVGHSDWNLTASRHQRLVLEPAK